METSWPCNYPGLPEPDAGKPLKPSGSAELAPDCPWSEWITTIRLDQPAEPRGALAQRVLTLGRLSALVPLAQRGLAHIQVRGARETLGG